MGTPYKLLVLLRQQIQLTSILPQQGSAGASPHRKNVRQARLPDYGFGLPQPQRAPQGRGCATQVKWNEHSKFSPLKRGDNPQLGTNFTTRKH